MSTNLLLLIIFGYFLMLMIVSRLTSRKTKATSFFDGDHKSPWLLVAFGMIGSGISAVSLVSIPGNVGNENLYYFQFILIIVGVWGLGGWFYVSVLGREFHDFVVFSVMVLIVSLSFLILMNRNVQMLFFGNF